MENNEESSEFKESVLEPWVPEKLLRQVDSSIVHYSRGYLRSHPERWFPGFSSDWLPLSHSLGVELKAVEIKPIIGVPRGQEFGYVGSIDDEPFAIIYDDTTAHVLADVLIPNGGHKSHRIVLNYLARRLVHSLAGSWSGSSSAVVRFEPNLPTTAIREAGGVKLVVSVNGSQVIIWFVLGKIMVERFDGLWRRQLLSHSKKRDHEGTLAIELANLNIPPTFLGQYVKQGNNVDLEVPASDLVNLYLDGKHWSSARLFQVDSNFGLEILATPNILPKTPEGTTSLSVQIGSMSIEPHLITELTQPGAMLATSINLSDQVEIVVRGEKVAAALVRLFQNNFAFEVI